MAIYKVLMSDILTKVVSVEADSAEEAISIVEEQSEKGIHQLDLSDYTETKFEIYED